MQKKLDAFKHIGASWIDCLLERVAVVEKKEVESGLSGQGEKNCATTDCVCERENRAFGCVLRRKRKKLASEGNQGMGL